MNESQTPASPLRVLFVLHSADLYGANRCLLRLIMTIDRRRFSPLAVLPEDGPLKKLIEAQGVEVVINPNLSIITRRVFRSWRILPFLLNYPCSVLSLKCFIKQKGVHLVHSNSGVLVSPALAAWLAGAPHIWHIRESFHDFRSFWPAFSWFITKFSSRVMTVSNPVAEQFHSRKNVVVVHDGFPREEFDLPKEKLRAEFQARYGLAGHFVVGCVGRIKWVRKGQEFLVQAAALLKQRGLSIKALIVGAPFRDYMDHLTRLRELTHELKVEDNVVFAGELPDARGTYAAMDVLALTSAQPEPFGGVVMEAMAMGLPVVATNIGGSLDQVADGVTGLLVPPGDSAALADAIEKLMVNPELCRRMGKAGVERIHTHFSLAEMTNKIERLFDDAIAERTSR
jgi:glycosyltransferase involved in cell wall biosynthesis